jgi:hypothetical protein
MDDEKIPQEDGRKNKEEEWSEEDTDKLGRGHPDHKSPPKAWEIRRALFDMNIQVFRDVMQ